MTREEKNQFIISLTEELNNSNYFYLTDIADLDSETTTSLRRLCSKKEVKLTMVKNTLLKKAMEKPEKELESLYDVLVGSTSIMFAQAGNAPAKLIKEFTKKNKTEKPALKAAYVEETTYVGADQLDILVNIKSKNELIGDIIGLLQSPDKNVISALQSSGQTISGVLKTLSEKPE